MLTLDHIVDLYENSAKKVTESLIPDNAMRIYADAVIGMQAMVVKTHMQLFESAGSAMANLYSKK